VIDDVVESPKFSSQVARVFNNPPVVGCAIAQTKTTLDIYVVDVEGGNATLFVAPSGESVLIDTGNFAPDAAKRDAERIMAVVVNGHYKLRQNAKVTVTLTAPADDKRALTR
jgi:sugar lactone lactonase YvrE